MRALEKVLHCLRPMVSAEKWEYLVIWKLGDDPSRFIQWVGCCCSGAHGVCENVEEEKGEESRGFDLCVDIFSKHFAKSKACLELAKFPPSIPLYSGIHGETVVTSETRWMRSCSKDSSSNLSDELSGTRVLIPVAGGLVELFAARNVLRDEKIIEFVTSQCMIKMENEVEPIATHIYTSENFDIQPQISLPDPYSYIGSTLLHHLNSNYSPKIPKYPSFEGSSSGSNPIHGNFSLNSYSGHVSPNGSVNELVEKNQIYTTLNRDINLCFEKETVNAVSLIERENLNSGVRLEQDQCHSKNLITERNRRMRINDGLLTLRSLVPKISKMNKASVLVDAIAYITELHNETMQLEDELKETTEAESNNKTNPSEIDENPKMGNVGQSCSSGTKHIPAQIEVTQIGIQDFLVKVSSTHRQGGFVRLIEGLYALGLQVIDANTTTFNGQTMNIFKVEVIKTGIQTEILKESLIKLTRNLPE